MDCHELHVIFEKRFETVVYPYMGQISVMGHIEPLLDGAGVRLPREYLPACASQKVQEYMERAFEAGRFHEIAGRPFPFVVPPTWFDADDGWKTVNALRAAIHTDAMLDAGLARIAKELIVEADSLAAVFERAAVERIKFHMNLYRCAAPPAKLEEWVHADFAELAGEIREMLEANGIKVSE